MKLSYCDWKSFQLRKYITINSPGVRQGKMSWCMQIETSGWGLPQPKQFYRTKESFLPSSLLICSQSHLRTKGDFPCPHFVFNWHGFRSSSEEFFEPNISEVIWNQSIFGHQNPGSGSVFSLKCWIWNQLIRIRNTVRKYTCTSIYVPEHVHGKDEAHQDHTSPEHLK